MEGYRKGEEEGRKVKEVTPSATEHVTEGKKYRGRVWGLGRHPLEQRQRGKEDYCTARSIQIKGQCGEFSTRACGEDFSMGITRSFPTTSLSLSLSLFLSLSPVHTHTHTHTHTDGSLFIGDHKG